MTETTEVTADDARKNTDRAWTKQKTKDKLTKMKVDFNASDLVADLREKLATELEAAAAQKGQSRRDASEAQTGKPGQPIETRRQRAGGLSDRTSRGPEA